MRTYGAVVLSSEEVGRAVSGSQSGSRMNPDDFRSLCIELFGKRGWQIGCARFLKKPDGTHLNVRTVRRWGKGDASVPFWVEPLLWAEQGRRCVI
ncbi:hypothetical protein SAMN05444166_1424 [Singulisphaera sp. GP187]|nr:hypothetical protein SAMN05444166_1424 [Singulisphaera sp. GP187]